MTSAFAICPRRALRRRASRAGRGVHNRGRCAIAGPRHPAPARRCHRLRRGAHLVRIPHGWICAFPRWRTRGPVTASRFDGEAFLIQGEPVRDREAARLDCGSASCLIAMKLKLDITPDLVAAMAAEVKAGEKAVTAAMREAGTGLKTAWRGQITGAGARPAAGEFDPQPVLSEGRREPECRGAGLVECAGHRRRA